MLHKILFVLKVVRAIQFETMGKVTVGQVARRAKKSYSTVSRHLQIALNSELVDCDIVAYKSTGKKLFFLTEKGIAWMLGYKELPL